MFTFLKNLCGEQRRHSSVRLNYSPDYLQMRVRQKIIRLPFFTQYADESEGIYQERSYVVCKGNLEFVAQHVVVNRLARVDRDRG